MKPTQKLHDLGQSLWLDNITRELLTNAADGGDAEEMIVKFAKVGIDCDKLASDLQREGSESFVKDWAEMLASIASKSAAFKAAG